MNDTMPTEPVYWEINRSIETLHGCECHACGETVTVSRITKRYTCPICRSETVAPYPFCPQCGYHITMRGGVSDG